VLTIYNLVNVLISAYIAYAIISYKVQHNVRRIGLLHACCIPI